MVRCMIALTAFFALAGSARAELVTFAFAGPAEGPFGPASALLGNVLGTPVSGVITYDPAAIWVGRGLPPSMESTSPGGFTLEMGGFTFTSPPSANLTIHLPPPFVYPGGVPLQRVPIFFRTAARDPGIFGQPATGYFGLELSLEWPSVSEALPTDLSRYRFIGGYVGVSFVAADQSHTLVSAGSFLTEFHPVTAPEPGTLVLAGVGAGLTLLARRRRMPG